MNWKESIKEGTMLLRDIVDLEATFDMTDIGTPKIDPTIKIIEEKKQVKEKKIKES